VADAAHSPADPRHRDGAAPRPEPTPAHAPAVVLRRAGVLGHRWPLPPPGAARIQRDLSNLRRPTREAFTYANKLEDKRLFELLKQSSQVFSQVSKYNRAPENGTQRQELLRRIVPMLHETQQQLDATIGNFSDPASRSDSAVYGSLVELQDRLTRLAEESNGELARQLGIERAGPGGRPDANTEEGIEASIEGMDLGEQQEFYESFLEDEGDHWKQKREALSGAWALASGKLESLSAATDNAFGIDVEYRTEDEGVPSFWDQKTIYYAEEPWDGRLAKTYGKLETELKKMKDPPIEVGDIKAKVGLLLDSTYVRRPNYERAWMRVLSEVLEGNFDPRAIKEVRAPEPGLLRAGLYVDMTEKSPKDPKAKNIKWAEPKLSGTVGDLPVMPASGLGATQLSKVLDRSLASWGRHTNARGWLPPGAYAEYSVGGGVPDGNSARFVATDDRSRIYLSVTHYKGYTVKLGTGEVVNRNPFYRVQ
jgi:hypothetical protein